MKPNSNHRHHWRWPYPYLWRQVYANIIGLLLVFLTVVFLLDALKGTLP